MDEHVKNIPFVFPSITFIVQEKGVNLKKKILIAKVSQSVNKINVKFNLKMN